MKLILLQHLSGADGAKEPGDIIEVSDEQAVAFIEKEIAKCKTKKEEKSFFDKIESIKAKQLEKEQAAAAILYEDELKDKKAQLEMKLAEINTTLGIKEVVITEEEFIQMGGVLEDAQDDIPSGTEDVNKEDDK